jgi:hypothetical protein
MTDSARAMSVRFNNAPISLAAKRSGGIDREEVVLRSVMDLPAGASGGGLGRICRVHG